VGLFLCVLSCFFDLWFESFAGFVKKVKKRQEKLFMHLTPKVSFQTALEKMQMPKINRWRSDFKKKKKRKLAKSVSCLDHVFFEYSHW
jgi:hypothetical protein